MKTVVVTGSARGFGLALLEEFRSYGYNCVICDNNSTELLKAKKRLMSRSSKGKILSFKMDVSDPKSVKNVIDKTLLECKKIDVWINNAGVNQPDKPIWDLELNEVNKVLDVDLKGAVLSTRLILDVMKNQRSGKIFNVEGFGSNDKYITGLSIYATAKRAITYFTEALAKEVEELGLNIRVGKISPGIMITNFVETSLGDGEKIELDAKTKRVYNILGDYPETIAKYVVKNIIECDKNNVKIEWLTNKKATLRFMTSFVRKNKFFKE